MSRSSCAQFPDHSIVDELHGGGLGTDCDGGKNGTCGDQDGAKNGIIVTKPLESGHTYLLDQTTTPSGYRRAPNRTVTTVAGQDAIATIKNRAKR